MSLFVLSRYFLDRTGRLTFLAMSASGLSFPFFLPLHFRATLTCIDLAARRAMTRRLRTYRTAVPPYLSSFYISTCPQEDYCHPTTELFPLIFIDMIVKLLGSVIVLQFAFLCVARSVAQPAINPRWSWEDCGAYVANVSMHLPSFTPT